MGRAAENGMPTTSLTTTSSSPAERGPCWGTQFAAARGPGGADGPPRGQHGLEAKRTAASADSVVQTVDEILRDLPDGGGEYQIPSFTPCGTWAWPPPPSAVSAELLRPVPPCWPGILGVRFHTHFSARPRTKERYVPWRSTASGPLAYMEILGWLGPTCGTPMASHFQTRGAEAAGGPPVTAWHCPFPI